MTTEGGDLYEYRTGCAEAPRTAVLLNGGKWNLASWIISFFPPHKNYVEPCGGAASVLLQKPRSPLETYNDLDGNVVNFFRVLRDRPDELIRKIRLTPWARAEYELSLESLDIFDDVERARLFWCRIAMSLNAGSALRSPCMRFTKDDHAKAAEAYNRNSVLENFLVVSDRLSTVQIEQRDFLRVIQEYDNENALTYFDPPYVSDTRREDESYELEWDEVMHIAAASLLRQCAGYVVVSGYACPLYTELYEAHGWQRHDKEAQTNSGGKRIESVWLSPRTVEALNMPRQGSLL